MLSFALFGRKDEVNVLDPCKAIQNAHRKKTPKNISWAFPQDHAVAIYTVLSILFRMRQELGLEAMLEFMGKYRQTVEEHNPKIKNAVSQALSIISVQKIFKEAAGHERL